jgi:hypothetical protein
MLPHGSLITQLSLTKSAISEMFDIAFARVIFKYQVSFLLSTGPSLEQDESNPHPPTPLQDTF